MRLSVLQLLKSDLIARRINASLFNIIKTYFHPYHNTFRYTVWLRIGYALHRHKIVHAICGPLVFLIRHHYEVKYGIQAHSGIPIGPGLHIVHGGCLFLNCASIGKHFTVYQGVTLGTRGNNTKCLPIIGNDVTIYTGAVVAGGVRIGDGAIIGANSVVSHDVPPFTLVAGAPARVIKDLKEH